MVADLSGRGMTIILTTHYMAEADELCDRLAIIDRGVIQVQGTPAELKRATTDATVVDIVAVGVTADHLDRLRRLDGRPAVTQVEDAAGFTISIHSALPAADVIMAAVRELADVRIVRLTLREATLEDAYVSVVNEAVTSPGTTPSAPGTRSSRRCCWPCSSGRACAAGRSPPSDGAVPPVPRRPESVSWRVGFGRVPARSPTGPVW